MKKEEIEKLAEKQTEKGRLAESLLKSSAWQKFFEPLILNKKIEYYKNIENCPEGKAEAFKEALKALKSLKIELEELIGDATGAGEIKKKLE